MAITALSPAATTGLAGLTPMPLDTHDKGQGPRHPERGQQCDSCGDASAEVGEPTISRPPPLHRHGQPLGEPGEGAGYHPGDAAPQAASEASPNGAANVSLMKHFAACHYGHPRPPCTASRQRLPISRSNCTARPKFRNNLAKITVVCNQGCINLNRGLGGQNIAHGAKPVLS